MRIIYKDQAVEYKNGKTCIAYEYPANDPDINAALVKINGRYPESGLVMNKICKELAYIIHGNGAVIVDGKKLVVKEGDQVLLSPGEKYYWEGELEMLVPSYPAWSLDQHVNINN